MNRLFDSLENPESVCISFTEDRALLSAKQLKIFGKNGGKFKAPCKDLTIHLKYSSYYF